MRAYLAGLLLLSSSSLASAQVITDAETARGLSPGPNRGAFVPYDGAPFSHRYHYGSGANIYINGCSGSLWNHYYLDRLERAERFGYALPAPPPSLYGTQTELIDPDEPAPPPPVAAPRSVRVGVGIGLFRWR